MSSHEKYCEIRGHEVPLSISPNFEPTKKAVFTRMLAIAQTLSHSNVPSLAQRQHSTHCEFIHLLRAVVGALLFKKLLLDRL